MNTATKMTPPKGRQDLARLGLIARLGDTKAPHARLKHAGGREIPLPDNLLCLLVRIAGDLESGKSVVVMSSEQDMTPQTAADFLGMSRQFLMRLLDRGELPFHRVGAHRRLLRKDVELYARKRAARRRATLEQLRDKIHAAGLDR